MARPQSLAAKKTDLQPAQTQSVTLRREAVEAILDRVFAPQTDVASLSASDRFNHALGCRTSEAALAFLGQLIRLEGPDQSPDEQRLEHAAVQATALLAELGPANPMEALLSVRLIAADRASQVFLTRSLAGGT